MNKVASHDFIYLMLYNDSETQVMADNALKIKINVSDHDTDEKKKRYRN